MEARCPGAAPAAFPRGNSPITVILFLAENDSPAQAFRNRASHALIVIR
jgi:hypothetical protein